MLKTRNTTTAHTTHDPYALPPAAAEAWDALLDADADVPSVAVRAAAGVARTAKAATRAIAAAGATTPVDPVAVLVGAVLDPDPVTAYDLLAACDDELRRTVRFARRDGTVPTLAAWTEANAAVSEALARVRAVPTPTPPPVPAPFPAPTPGAVPARPSRPHEPVAEAA